MAPIAWFVTRMWRCDVAGYFIGWWGLAFINAALANMDGRSPLKYLLASLFLGPIITIVLAGTREERGALRQVDLWRGRDYHPSL